MSLCLLASSAFAQRGPQPIPAAAPLVARGGEVEQRAQGAQPTGSLFQGLTGSCGALNNGDAVVKYDQLADRWLVVMPIFRRPANDSTGPYAMCYAVNVGPDPLGPYFRYTFDRK